MNLSVELKDVKGKYSSLKVNYTNSKTKVNLLKKELLELNDLYSNLTTSLSSSLQWLKSNSYLSSSLLDSEISSCKDGNKFNYACFIYLMSDEGKIRYELEEQDRLKSISEILSEGKGDCEDFSLLAVSVLNKLKKEGVNELVLYKDESGRKFDLFEKGSYLYYLSDAKPIYKDLNNVAVVCYIKDPLNYEGHCIVSVYSKEVNDGYFFEPQTGELVENKFYLCNGSVDCNKKNAIFIYFNDKDLKIYSNNRWNSYVSILQKLTKIKEDFNTFGRD